MCVACAFCTCRCGWSIKEGNQGYFNPIWSHIACSWPEALRTEEVWWPRSSCTLPEVIPLISLCICLVFHICCNKYILNYICIFYIHHNWQITCCGADAFSLSPSFPVKFVPDILSQCEFGYLPSIGASLSDVEPSIYTNSSTNVRRDPWGQCFVHFHVDKLKGLTMHFISL